MCVGDERPQEFCKCLSQHDMSLDCRVQPVNRQAPIQYVPQIPHVHSNTGVIRSHLLRDLCVRIRVTGWRLQAEVRERVLQRGKKLQARKKYQKATYEDAYVGECLAIYVHEARDEGTHRLDEEGRLYTDTSVVRSCLQQYRYVIDMHGGAARSCR